MFIFIGCSKTANLFIEFKYIIVVAYFIAMYDSYVANFSVDSYGWKN